MNIKNRPAKRGLYDPFYEHDACGIGFVASIEGEKTNRIVKQGLQVLRNLEHRGARGVEENTGDGAGILMQLPHDFFQQISRESGIELPGLGEYGVGMFFLPRDKKERQKCENEIQLLVENEGQSFLGWREVPVRDEAIGVRARKSRPYIKQLFIGKENNSGSQLEFERCLYLLRRQLEKKLKGDIYIPSLSSRTLVYKGMLTATQLENVYPDLRRSEMKSALVLIHSR
ncbi:MAG: glutamate synthase subunit alpha, partial [Halanaerobiaceae bacterium]